VFTAHRFFVSVNSRPERDEDGKRKNAKYLIVVLQGVYSCAGVHPQPLIPQWSVLVETIHPYTLNPADLAFWDPGQRVTWPRRVCVSAHVLPQPPAPNLCNVAAIVNPTPLTLHHEP